MEEPLFSFPSKQKIKKILRLFDVETSDIIFSHSYEEGKRIGILWKKNKSKKQMFGIEEHFKKHNVEILRHKTFGEVHSIFFVKTEVKN